MSRVEINAGDRHVVVDHEGELAHLADTAQRLWRETEQPLRPGPAVGFSAQLRYVPDVTPVGNGQYGYPSGPVTAREEA
jgi:hypothetical protein